MVISYETSQETFGQCYHTKRKSPYVNTHRWHFWIVPDANRKIWGHFSHLGKVAMNQPFSSITEPVGVRSRRVRFASTMFELSSPFPNLWSRTSQWQLIGNFEKLHFFASFHFSQNWSRFWNWKKSFPFPRSSQMFNWFFKCRKL